MSETRETAGNRANLPEFTVSELSAALKRTVEDAFPYVRVRGELGKVTRHSSGHIYLDLKDQNATIAGVDNGDPISHAPFQADSVRVFNGRALVILRATREPGAVTLTARADGLDSASTRIALARAGTRASPR